MKGLWFVFGSIIGSGYAWAMLLLAWSGYWDEVLTGKIEFILYLAMVTSIITIIMVYTIIENYKRC